jgi:hypothetical protein
MFEKKFDLDKWNHSAPAYTLSPDEVLENHHEQTGHHTRTHADGWTISGFISEDYYYWVNAFEASHPVFGRVWGDFEETVYADSQLAFDVFFRDHGPDAWDYYDI